MAEPRLEILPDNRAMLTFPSGITTIETATPENIQRLLRLATDNKFRPELTSEVNELLAGYTPEQQRQDQLAAEQQNLVNLRAQRAQGYVSPEVDYQLAAADMGQVVTTGEDLARFIDNAPQAVKEKVSSEYQNYLRSLGLSQADVQAGVTPESFATQRAAEDLSQIPTRAIASAPAPTPGVYSQEAMREAFEKAFRSAGQTLDPEKTQSWVDYSLRVGFPQALTELQRLSPGSQALSLIPGSSRTDRLAPSYIPVTQSISRPTVVQDYGTYSGSVTPYTSTVTPYTSAVVPTPTFQAPSVQAATSLDLLSQRLPTQSSAFGLPMEDVQSFIQSRAPRPLDLNQSAMPQPTDSRRLLDGFYGTTPQAVDSPLLRMQQEYRQMQEPMQFFREGGVVKKFADGGPSSGVRRLEMSGYQAGGEVTDEMFVGTRPEDFPETSPVDKKAGELLRALSEGTRGFVGAEPIEPGSEAYRTGQALANMPAVGVVAATAKGAGKSVGQAKALMERMTPELEKFLKDSVVKERLYRGQRRAPAEEGFALTQGRGTPSFTTDTEVANVYSRQLGFGNPEYGPGSTVVPAYVQMKNPLDIRDLGEYIDLESFVNRLPNVDLNKPTVKNGFGYEDIAKMVRGIGSVASKTGAKYEIEASSPGSIFRVTEFDELADAIEELGGAGKSEKIQEMLFDTSIDAFLIGDSKNVKNALKEKGFDGVIHKDAFDVGGQYYQGDPKNLEGGTYAEYIHDSYRPFFQEKIKSAVGNVGTYDTTKKAITKAKGGEITNDEYIQEMMTGTRFTDFPEMSPVDEKAAELLRALSEGTRGFVGAEPIEPGSEAYRTGQALANMPAIGVAAGTIKGAGKAKDALKALTKKAEAKEPKAPEIKKSGKLTEVEKELLQRGGERQAKRLQRAADEIPGLEDQYQSNALIRTFLGRKGYPYQGVMTMRPGDFEKFAAYLGPLDDQNKEKIENLRKILVQGGSFDDVPFLMLDRKDNIPFIAGHEGRHRMRALGAANQPKSLVEVYPRSGLEMGGDDRPMKATEWLEKFNEALGEGRLVVPEGLDPAVYFDDLFKERLPDVYAKGGEVTNDEFIKSLGDRSRKDLATIKEAIAEIGKNKDRYADLEKKGYTPRDIEDPVKNAAYGLFLTSKTSEDPQRFLSTLSPFYNSKIEFDYTTDRSTLGEVQPYSTEARVYTTDDRGVALHELVHTLQMRRAKDIAEGEKEINKPMSRVVGDKVFQRAADLAKKGEITFPATNWKQDKGELMANVYDMSRKYEEAGKDFTKSIEFQKLFPDEESRLYYYTQILPDTSVMYPAGSSFEPIKTQDKSKSYARQLLGFAAGGEVTDFIKRAA